MAKIKPQIMRKFRTEADGFFTHFSIQIVLVVGIRKISIISVYKGHLSKATAQPIKN